MSIRRLCPLCVNNVQLRNNGVYRDHKISKDFKKQCAASGLPQRLAHKIYLDRQRKQ